MMSYKKEDLPYLRGVVEKVRHAEERLRTERGIISICLGVDYLGDEDKEQLRQILAHFLGAEEIIQNLTQRIRGRIKVLTKIN